MRPSMISRSGRAASHLCSACQKEAIRSAGATVPRAFSPSTLTSRPTATRKQPQPIPSSQRWISHSRPTLSSSSSSSPNPTDSSSSSPKQLPKKPTPTYYALFPQTLPDGPPPHGPFQIDLRSLKREFLRLQAASHPDFHHSAGTTQSDSEAEAEAKVALRREAEKTSALINTAYKTLSSPLLRAQYLLHELYGINLADDESGSQSGGGGTDPELLMTVLEAREMIEEAEREEDLDELRGVNEARIEESVQKIGEAFARADVEGVREETVRLRYWVNIREGINNWEKGKGVVLHH